MASGFSALGRLATVIVLSGAFLFGMAGVVYMSLQGKEVQVPEITGKALTDGERELALLGLKVKKRADRFSPEAAGTVIEQLPKAGDTVKTGQTIRVVVSKGPGEGDTPPSLKNTSEEDDSEKIEEMISEKPKKTKANSNTNRKKADTARDVNGAGDTGSDNNSASPSSNSKPKEPGANTVDRPKANTQTPPATRGQNPPGRTETRLRQP